MDRKAFVAGLLPVLLLYACDRTLAPEPGAATALAAKAEAAAQAKGASALRG